jgi:hypothetical protein
MLTLLLIFMGLLLPMAQAEKNNITIISTTLEDQTAVSVTVYNVNLGLIKDRRNLSLFTGQGEVRFMDVPAKIIPTSVYIKSRTTNKDEFHVLEQNYEYDLLSPQKLLEKYIGKEVKLYEKNPYTDKVEIVTATVLSSNTVPVFKIGDEITFNHPGRILFPKIPENLISEPTLVWLIDNKGQLSQEIEASFLTDGITWHSDYVVTLNQTDDHADLLGWVTIDNQSGALYKNATVKLVAGDVQRLEPPPVPARYDRQKMVRAEAAPQFKEEEFFEYHIYTLERPATIKNNQTKQIQFVSAQNIAVKKELIFEGVQHFFRSQQPRTLSNQKVSVFIEISNKKESNLGIPLPKGTVRVYKHDTEGSLQFIGENTIDHTPKDEKIKIKTGDAFDVLGDRKQTEWRKISSDTYEMAFEISLRNHKEEDVTVKVTEPIAGDWEILTSSHNYKKTEAHTAEFTVSVPKDGEVKITYKVRVKF